MKKLTSVGTVLFCIALILITPSCKKFSGFLDKAPGVNVDQSTLFSSQIQLDQFVATIYKDAMPTEYNYQDASQTTDFKINDATTPAQGTESITDEGKASEAAFIQTNLWNSGSVTPDNITSCEDRRYYQRWIALQEIALMLQNVDTVPDATPEYKAQVKSEVKVLRALVYLELVKRYGGVPIVTQVFAAGVNINAIVPRASISDTFAFIVKDCNDAISATNADGTVSLPATYSAALTGRITRLAAYAVKAKALLYAASPLYNTGTPYLDFGANNKLICYTNYDVNRWNDAAKASLDVLNNAPASNVKLIDVASDENPTIPANNSGPVVGNYSNAWEIPNNSEIILSFQGYNFATTSNPPVKFINPTFTGTSWSGVTVPLNFVMHYEQKADGTPLVWDPNGGTDLIAMYNKLDPRFKQTIGYTGTYWNPQNTIAPIYAGGGTAYNNCSGGSWMHKMIPRAATPGVKAAIVDMTLSLHEFYLDYAEALNESNSTPPQAAYDAVNAIRKRSGMPGFPTGLTQDAFRTKLQNERSVELAYEEHRFWDIKRWMIAENPGVMQGPMFGLHITKTGSTYSWVPYVFETRVWLRKEYMHPFPQSEVNKGGLIQNPGW